MSNFSLFTYNIHKGFTAGNLEFKLHQMRDAVEAIGPDIVCLQEVQGQHDKQAKKVDNWPEESQFDFIAENLWPHVAYGKNARYSAGHHGNAILSKFPIIAWDNINVSHITSASRSLLHAKLEIPNQSVPLHVMCIHFGLFKQERHTQLGTLTDRITHVVPKNEPLIIAGDFNDWRVIAREYLETDLGLREAFQAQHGQYAKTFPSWAPTLVVDRVYYRNCAIDQAECLDTPTWRGLSDHLPLFADFLYEE